jgi:hypothetical protein
VAKTWGTSGGIMSYRKTIVCLANSRKTSGRCIVGKEIVDRRIGQWIRPVSDRESREVSESERQYSNGTDPRLLDIIGIWFEQPIPICHQTENHIIDPECYWEKIGTFSWQDIPKLLDHRLKANPITEDFMSIFDDEPTIKDSVYLIKVENVTILVGPKAPEYSSKRNVRARFDYRGESYLIDVTDPYIERIYLAKSNGEYVLSSPYLCVSLGEIFTDGFCYKFVAAILTEDRYR